MNVNWFKNPDNIVYANIDEFVPNFENETGIENLRKKIDEFKKNPVKEGITLVGRKRTSVKLIIPNLTFDEKLEMGDNVWIYLGENYECYCLYIPEHWVGKNYAFFNHKTCEYFPCHKTNDPDNFNCLFCYCPLYALKDKCGGNFKYTEDGIKDCSGCSLPHKRENFGYIMNKFSDLVEITKL